MANKPVPVKILSQLLDMGVRNVQLLAASGVIPKPIEGKYDLVACVVGYIRHLRKIGQGQGSASLIDERAELTKIKKEREQLRLDTDRGNLLPKGESVRWVSLLVAECKAALMNFPRRMSASLAPIADEKEIELLLRQEIWGILRQLAKEGKKGSRRSLKKKSIDK